MSQRGPDGGGGPIPSDVVDWAIDSINSVFSGGIKGPNPRQERALEQAGFEQRVRLPDGAIVSPDDPRVTGRPNRRGTIEVWIAPGSGAILGPTAARQTGRQLRRNPPPAPPAGGGGPSPADRPPATASGFPIAWPFPISIPGRAAANLPPWLKKFLIANPGAAIAAALLWPVEAGRGSDLRDLYGVPKPKGAPGRRGRRRRAKKPPPGRGDPWGRRPRVRPGAQAQPGRGGAVTIGRPRAAAPPAVATVAMPPRPRSLPRAVKVDVGKISAPAPAPIKATGVQRVVQLAQNPIIRAALGAGASAALASLLAPAAPKLGRVQLPGTTPAPSPATSPLTALYPSALPYARAFASPATAAQEQDCSCRPARKKSKKKPCKNPVTSRRSFERDGARFVTTTKELKCPGSSRKKRRSRPAP